jgi:hypothetical protein
MFSSTCNVCFIIITTQTNQSTNPNFRCKSCSKSCSKSSAKIKENVMIIADKIKSDHQCVKCLKIVQITPKSFAKHDSVCIECYNSEIYPFHCSICFETFHDSHDTYNKYNKAICQECRKFI